MEVVINISENIYNLIVGGEENRDFVYKSDLMRAILEGTPIPKGHGGLIDADELALQIADLSGDILNPCYGVTYSDIKNAPVIIKADREVSE